MRVWSDEDAYHWVAAADGQVPQGAVPHGRDADGTAVWVCRAWFAGGLHPGSVRAAGAKIAWGGQEVPVREYEVLMEAGVWVDAVYGAVPPQACAAGREESGETLYVARARIEDGLVLGKVQPKYQAANIGYAGEERQIEHYQVLVLPGPAGRTRDRLGRGESLGDGDALTSPSGRIVLTHDGVSGLSEVRIDGTSRWPRVRWPESVLRRTGDQNSPGT